MAIYISPEVVMMSSPQGLTVCWDAYVDIHLALYGCAQEVCMYIMNKD